MMLIPQMIHVPSLKNVPQLYLDIVMLLNPPLNLGTVICYLPTKETAWSNWSCI